MKALSAWRRLVKHNRHSLDCRESVYGMSIRRDVEIFGPTAERLIGPVYIRYVFIRLPLLVIAFFVFRFISARRRHARLG